MSSEPEKQALADKYGPDLSSMEANQHCIDLVREALLDPTSLQFTSPFRPDSDWIHGGLFEAQPVWMSAKVLVRNRAGNLAPQKLICRYDVASGAPVFASYELYNGF